MTAALLVAVRDARRRPLDDRADIRVLIAGSSAIVRAVDDVSTRKAVRIPGLQGGRPYLVRVYPRRHRPVGRIASLPPSGEARVELFCPVIPERVREVRFPAFGDLDGGLKGLLERSERVEGSPGRGGPALYEGLPDLQRAGLLNLYAKMRRTVLPGGRPVSRFATSLYRIRGDRVFADVERSLRDEVKTAVATGDFEGTPGVMHTPPPGFERAGSFKTRDGYGNLQLTFFASREGPLTFKVDADIDDARGIRHAFDVLEHALTGTGTHPYDIQQILLLHQGIDPGYELVT